MSGAPVIDSESLADWCRAVLGAAPAEELFRAGYLSAVVGVRLDDDREVVVKVRQHAARLRACVDVQAALADAGFACPRPLSGVADLNGFAATAESYAGGGAAMPTSGRDPAPFAAALWDLVRHAPSANDVATLAPAPAWVAWNHAGTELWPWPDDHDQDLNDVDGPAWIDDAGRAARDRLRAHHASAVIGHCDWYAGNLRWKRNSLFVAHDWDSAFADTQAAIVGFAAAVYPTTRAGDEASIDETEAFIEHYQDASQQTFSSDDVECCWAAGVWLRAFDSKKQHAKGQPICSLDEAQATDRLGRAGAR